jgi:hypothetical protein
VPPQAPTPARARASSKASRPSTATRIEPRAPATRPSRTQSATRPDPAPAVRPPQARIAARPQPAPTTPRIATRPQPAPITPRIATRPQPAPSLLMTQRADTGREPRPRILVVRSPPSFDCRYAGSSVEVAICTDPWLAAKDRRMALLYEQRGGSRHGPVDAGQWRWLAARNACGRAPPGALEACIRQAYDARIAELAGAGWWD